MYSRRHLVVNYLNTAVSFLNKHNINNVFVSGVFEFLYRWTNRLRNGLGPALHLTHGILWLANNSRHAFLEWYCEKTQTTKLYSKFLKLLKENNVLISTKTLTLQSNQQVVMFWGLAKDQQLLNVQISKSI